MREVVPVSSLRWLTLFAALSVGCTVYDPEILRAAQRRDASVDAALPVDGGPGDSGALDASRDAAADAPMRDAASPDGGGGCLPLHPPDVGGGDPGGDGELLFALRDVILDQRGGRWERVAYDLDDLCTSDRDMRAPCLSPGSSSAPLDGRDGIDNAAGRDIFTFAATFDPTFEANAREDQVMGEGVMLVHIGGWNGTPNDPRVDVYFAQGTRMTDAAGTGAPTWDGTDQVWLSTSDFAGGNPTMPLIRDDVAHITDGTVVMRIPEGRPVVFPWSGNLARLTLTGGTLTGRLPEGTGTTLTDVIVSGRWAVVDIADTLDAVGICAGSTERGFADTAIRNAADVRADPRTDGSGRGLRRALARRRLRRLPRQHRRGGDGADDDARLPLSSAVPSQRKGESLRGNAS